MSKFGNRKTVTDGITFDSQREAKRWWELKLLLRAGQIQDLQRQVEFELAPSVIIAGRKRPPLRYRCDFQYVENGKTVIEDAKGMVTKEYTIKRHLMKALLNLEIREV